MLDLIKRNAKAIVAFICSFIAMTWLHLTGHALDPDVEKALESLLIAILVWAIPNR